MSTISQDIRKVNRMRFIIKTIVSIKLSFLFFIILMSTLIFVLIGAYQKSNENSYGNSFLVGVPSEYIEYFNEASEIYGIPNWVLAAISKQESNFNPSTSYGGAYGIMQVQKYDSGSGKDLWAYLINLGLGNIYKNCGYSFSSSEEMWSIYLKDVRAQIIGGSYEIRYYANYVLKQQKKVSKLDYNSTENMQLINWSASETDSDFRETLRRIFACYNGGSRYGMNVDLDNAKFDYPNKVFKYAIEFRNTGLDIFLGDGVVGNNEIIETAIKVGSELVGKSPYVWGGGRNPSDIANRRFDCSSFVHWCFASAGLTLGDYKVVVTDSLANVGRKVNSSEMVRGDIIFFNTYKYNGHVGIYLGNNKFLHCGTSKGVWIDDLNSSYWKKVFNGNVRRVVENN